MKTFSIILLILFSILFINISKAKAIEKTELEWNTDLAEDDVKEDEDDYVKTIGIVEEEHSAVYYVPEEEHSAVYYVPEEERSAVYYVPEEERTAVYYEPEEERSVVYYVPEEETEVIEEKTEVIEEEIPDLLLRETTYGPVIGNSENNDEVLVWYNIPYASAPVGKLRWEAPVDPKPWKEALNCTAPGEIALQMSDDKVVGTEDCLNLDVYSTPKAKKLPVMVYIHGGNNQTGHSRELIGNEIVLKNNCIYISINYRLGIFGFNSLPALHTKKDSTGNYALLDMAKALDWIKENAEKFGGDSENITITGFSAGGRDVMAMLISPIFANKFHKAIVFSGGMTVADVDDSIKRTAYALAPLAVEDKVASSEEKAQKWLMTDSKEVKEWLYSVSSERLCALMGNAGIRMSVFPHLFNDDVVIPKEGFSTSKWNSVPVIMLTGSTEFSFFNFGASVWYIPNAFKAGAADQAAANAFSVHYGSEMYRIFNGQSSAEKMYDQYKDDIYVCQVDFGSEYSDYKIPGVGSFHGVFIPMLASEHGYAGMYNYNSKEYQAMATVFNKQLKSFLEDGNPNGEDLPEWKKWTPKHPVSMVLDAVDKKSSAQCKDVSTSFDKLIAEMEADTSVTEQGKSLVISSVLNGRWFSEPLDKHFKNPSLWDKYDVKDDDVKDEEEDYVETIGVDEEKPSIVYYIPEEEETEVVEEETEIVEETPDLLLRETTYGPVIGNSENNDEVLVWYNIPYASAPVGKLRWEAPVDPKPWKEALNCTAPGEIALQMSDNKVVGTEDCLNLDVYSTPKAKKLPVMVYIHGGNNQTGHSRELIGNEIVLKNNCIYISINYRLGIFGFNSLPALHTKKDSTGNYALLDMAKALDWIKENAEKFGGDSENITITGFSAGGRDVMAMLISPIFANKFHKAIVFSGGMTVADVDDSIKRTASVLAPLAVEDKVATSEEKAKEWLMTDSKEVKEWLYSVSSERLCALMGNAGIRMSVFPHLFNDDVVIPKEGFSTSKWNSVPVIMLTGSTEFSFFNFGASVWYIPNAFKAGAADQAAANAFSVHYGSEMYRIFNGQSSAEKMYDQYKDDIYVCQVDFGSEYSDYKIPGVGSFHGVFIPMLASEHGYAGMYNYDSKEYQAMATVFNKQLKSFLEDGNPNGEDLPEWKKWTPKHPVSMVLDAVDKKSSAQCKDVSTSFDKLIAEMEADTSVSEQGKSLVISSVLNGRWFSEPLDKHFKNPSLWK